MPNYIKAWSLVTTFTSRLRICFIPLTLRHNLHSTMQFAFRLSTALLIVMMAAQSMAVPVSIVTEILHRVWPFMIFIRYRLILFNASPWDVHLYLVPAPQHHTFAALPAHRWLRHLRYMLYELIYRHSRVPKESTLTSALQYANAKKKKSRQSSLPYWQNHSRDQMHPHGYSLNYCLLFIVECRITFRSKYLTGWCGWTFNRGTTVVVVAIARQYSILRYMPTHKSLFGRSLCSRSVEKGPNFRLHSRLVKGWYMMLPSDSVCIRCGVLLAVIKVLTFKELV